MDWTTDQLRIAVTPMICLDEGFRPSAYLDTEGFWTKGWGQRCQEGESCTRKEADDWRDQRLRELIAALDLRIPWFRNLSIPRAAVLVDLCYQIGLSGLMGFKRFLFELYNNRPTQAAVELLDSRLAQQTPARVNRLVIQILRDAIAA